MDVSFPRPLVEGHGRKKIIGDILKSFLVAFSQLRSAIERSCNEFDAIDNILMTLQSNSENLPVSVKLHKNLIMTNRDFMLNKNDLDLN